MQNQERLRFELKKPLLIIKQNKGFLACGYINVDTCNATEEACAIVKGVSSYEDMLKSPIVAISARAAALGVALGDTGETALQKMA